MDEVEPDEGDGTWRASGENSALADRDLAQVCILAMRREVLLLRVSRDAIMDERGMGIVRRVWEMAQLVE